MIAKLATLSLKERNSNRLLLIGSGGHARALIDIIESASDWRIVGLVGQSTEIGAKIFGYPVLGSDENLDHLRGFADGAILAMGHLGSATKRQDLALRLQALDFITPVIVSAHGFVSRHASLGPGTTVGHGAIVNAGASVGSHCIINSKALIEHDAIIGDHCHISTGVLINGGVSIGAASFIGSGSIVREGLVLPSETIVGAGKRVMGWPLSKESK
ncbi:NeuD/PglB/VioB family sugar acetyltransferase [Synechococcus sp. CCY 9618]|uniref:NeuD/PglB/VioB family sugar acetyltransferase n=1 Tax=Synechococcus sp. CCY 9618 TaxID=2815602 RepID=UPI001C229EDB|nr:NeuD/PglB/VioB family sugar acetyltransferase [Synechococcus sp. CCY 9618]